MKVSQRARNAKTHGSPSDIKYSGTLQDFFLFELRKESLRILNAKALGCVETGRVRYSNEIVFSRDLFRYTSFRVLARSYEATAIASVVFQLISCIGYERNTETLKAILFTSSSLNQVLCLLE